MIGFNALVKNCQSPFPRMFIFDDEPVFAIGLPKDVTTSGDVVDPTIWIDTGFLMRDICDEVFCVGKWVRINEEVGPEAADLTGLILSWLFRKVDDWGLIVWGDSCRTDESELKFVLDWRSVLVCCRFTSVCAASNNLASSGGASWIRSGNVGTVREFIGRTLLCCCLRAYELFNLCWPRGGEINGTNEGRCIKFKISSSRNVHYY